MKKIILFVGTLLFLGNSCSSSRPSLAGPRSVLPSSTYATSSTDGVKLAEQYVQLYDEYNEKYFYHKRIPNPLFHSSSFVDSTSSYRSYVTTYERNDCFGFANGHTYGGDLITTLIQNKEAFQLLSAVPLDKEAQQVSHIKDFTPDYLRELSAKVHEYVRKLYYKDLYSYYVCHLAPSVDVVAGSLWNASTSPYYVDQLQTIDTVGAFRSSTIVLVVRGKTVQGFTDLQTVDRTGTGDSAFPCKSTLKNNQIIWSCFAGLHECPSGFMTNEVNSWDLPVVGGRPVMRTMVDPTCADMENAAKKQ